MPSVAIVEDHLLLAETLSLALRRRGIDAAVVAPRPYPELLADLRSAGPDLVLVDLDLGPFGDGSALVAPLKAAGVPTLVVTGTVDRLRIAAALAQGALGYQPKCAGFDELLAAACSALSGAAPPDSAQRHALLTELARHRATQQSIHALFSLLTAREQATLRGLGEGYTVADIAAGWVVSEATVRTFVRGVLVKLGVTSQLAAVAIARRNGWLAAPAGRDEAAPGPRRTGGSSQCASNAAPLSGGRASRQRGTRARRSPA